MMYPAATDASAPDDARAGCRAVNAARARCSGVTEAVVSKYASTAAYCCGPSGGTASGSSGASFASSSDRATAAATASSDVSLIWTTACLGPNDVLIVTTVSVTSPAVASWFAAKRVLPATVLVTVTSHPSAVDRFSARSAI